MNHLHTTTGSTGLVTLIVTLISTKIIQYFGLGQSYYGLLYTGLFEAWNNVQLLNFNKLFDQNTHIALISFYGLILMSVLYYGLNFVKKIWIKKNQ